MSEPIIGMEEGQQCNRDGCDGIIVMPESENCSCHVSPPCHSCTDRYPYCPECGWEDVPEPYVPSSALSHTPDTSWWWKPRTLADLDATKIDYIIKSHSSCSQIVEGVYPPGTTAAEIRAKVDGTFGGKFLHFDNGRFKFLAYTD